MDSRVLFFVNGFMDMNQVAPLLIHAKRTGIRASVLFLFDDLKYPDKVFFREWRERVLRLPFLDGHEVVVAGSKWEAGVRLYLFTGVVVTSGPTYAQLFRRRLLPQWRWLRGNKVLVALDYFAERMDIVMPLVDYVVLSSEIWNNGYPADKTLYGLPYWDLFHADWERVIDDTSLPLGGEGVRHVLIPEMRNDNGAWFMVIPEYLQGADEADTRYFVKYRLKTKREDQEKRVWHKQLATVADVHAIYSPLYFTLRSLLDVCDEIVFSAGSSSLVFECMAAGFESITRIDRQKLEIWPIADVARCYDEYEDDPARARQKYIGDYGDNSGKLWSWISEMQRR